MLLSRLSDPVAECRSHARHRKGFTMKLNASITGLTGLPDGTYTGEVAEATLVAEGTRLSVAFRVVDGAARVGAYQRESWPLDPAAPAHAGLVQLVGACLGNGAVLEDTDQLLRARVVFRMKGGHLFVNYGAKAESEPAEQPASDDTPTE